MDKPNSNTRRPEDGQRAPVKKRRKNPAKAFFKAFGFILMTIILIGVTTAGICGMAFAVYIKKYVSTEVDVQLTDVQLKETSFIYYIDENGNEVELQKLHSGEDRVWIAVEDIPMKLKLAFISIEDNGFYEHNGVDWRRTIGAAIYFVVPFRDSFGGGSTITQQLIKNITGEDETSVVRKVNEVMRALELEKNYEKDDILEMYLNLIYFGQRAYGVQQAASTYFDKSLDELTLAECASLAGIVKNPYKYDLFRFPEHNKERRKVVLGEMLKYGNITQAEYDAAMKEKVEAVRSVDDDDYNEDVFQSYYVDAVINQLIVDIKEKFNYENDNLASSYLYNSGLKIYVPINIAVQEKMDAVFKDVENFPGDLGSDGTYPQAGMAIIDPETGYVLALYGGRGEKYANRVWNHATMSKRQPGSAIKPLTVYAPAIEYGLITPITVLDDAPKDFEVSEKGWPQNENRRYSGRTTIFRGVGSSLNTIAVDVMQQVGVDRAFNFAKTNMNLDLVTSMTVSRRDGTVQVLTDRAISPLALGGLTTGVTVLEMTAAYASFVNNGYYNEPILYTKVVDSSGKTVLENLPAEDNEPIMSARTRDYMIDLLTYVTSAGTGTKARIDGVEIGGKTGTTSDDNDRWFAGITPHYAGVVWFGFGQPQSLQKFSTNPALDLWHRVMESVYADIDTSAEGFTAKFSRMLQEEYTSVEYCIDSGLLATEACKADYRGTSRAATARILKQDLPTKTCDMHIMMEFDAATNGLATAFCPAGEGQRKMLGVLVYMRKYPIAGVAVADQEWVLDYQLTEVDLAHGLNKPSTPSKIIPCTVHNELNNGNIPEPEEPGEGGWLGDPSDPDIPTLPTDPDSTTRPDPWPTEPPATAPTDTDPVETQPVETEPPTITPGDTTPTGPPNNFPS